MLKVLALNSVITFKIGFTTFYPCRRKLLEIQSKVSSRRICHMYLCTTNFYDKSCGQTSLLSNPTEKSIHNH